ncbi:hypothetical protein B566_EDAN000943 [Ephemera danica]|nr:hypothetical protein B566_EDAN000943 [Ephemera danica]
MITFHPNDSKIELCGFACILENIISGSNKSELKPATTEEKALLWQWLEYAICVANFCDAQASALNELNEIFAQRSYLIGNRATVADAVFYYTLYPVVSAMSLQDKEKFRHLCRWFSTLQQIPGMRNPSKHKNLVFSRNPLFA